MACPADQISWILFDLGNVVVDYKPGGMQRMAEGLGIPVDRVGELFTDELANSVMAGALSPDQFAETVASSLDVSIAPRDIVDWYGPDVIDVFPEIPPLLARLSATYQLGILSNTFFGHWDYFLEMPVAGYFDCLMASHLLGCLKPDRRIYLEALACLDAAPEKVLFIDDREENVRGALAVGMHAFQSLHPTDTLSALQRLGVPPSS